MSSKMLLIDGDADKSEKIMSYVKKFGPFLSVLAYLSGIVYFLMLPHELLVHHTYISENALSPGKFLCKKSFVIKRRIRTFYNA